MDRCKDGYPVDPYKPMDAILNPRGFRRESSLNIVLESGQRKIVLYAFKAPDGTIQEVTHAAIQDDQGGWLSKLGQGPLIRHASLEVLNGPAYGEPVAIYVKVVRT